MRRPVCVKSVFLFLFSLSFLWIPCIRAGPPLSPSFHPHSWLSDFRSVHGGRSQFIRPRAFRHTMLTRWPWGGMLLSILRSGRQGTRRPG
jgi:hypothetical protein